MNPTPPAPPPTDAEKVGKQCPKCQEGRVRETFSDMSGERYRCDKCTYSYYIDYDDIR